MTRLTELIPIYIDKAEKYLVELQKAIKETEGEIVALKALQEKTNRRDAVSQLDLGESDRTGGPDTRTEQHPPFEGYPFVTPTDGDTLVSLRANTSMLWNAIDKQAQCLREIERVNTLRESPTK